MKNVYIIGHRQPDTDSVASVIGYAEFLNLREPGRYIPAVCGPLNAETRYVLAKLGIDPPLFVESVEPCVGDIPAFYTQRAPAGMPTIDVAAMMDEYEVRNIPIVDDEEHLVGLVSEHGLARAYVTPKLEGPLTIGPIPGETLARILDARICNEGPMTIHGRVYIVIDALHVALSRLESTDVAIVGDNEPTQLALLSAGIAALVVAEGAPVGERVLEAARKKGAAVFSTSLDAFSVGRMMHLSLPAGKVVATDVPVIRLEDTLAVAKKMVTDSKYRTACVVDANGVLLGMISRNTFLDDVQKKVILLDHNEYAQAVEGVESAEILEVIDHHRLGAITTLKPVRFQNEPLGSTSTIITRKFMESGTIPSPGTAGMLLAGILSDTLVLKMSTTAPEDIAAVAYLEQVTGLDAGTFGTDLIQHGMDLGNTPLYQLLAQDVKRYTLFGKEVVIAQVMTASRMYAQEHGPRIREELEKLRREHSVDLYMVLFTDIIANYSDLFAAGDHVTLKALGYEFQPVGLPGVMSRKKDFLPVFGGRLRDL
ncbi:MAG TPA: putative manganese-dependent inorganic diphosphatase [Methanolinea sp.]|nr:putative manganese-dependent inorganic diphosphatase [Methanolinea sp.]HQK55618.1 putative manganese-dependent inorganic diphosphatase [Methanolinea sp.]